MFKPNSVRRLLFGSQFKNPKLTHFIAEHAHPSLSDSCTLLEHSMFRINGALTKLCEFSGTHLKDETASLWNVAQLVEMNFSMIAVIARANRSYCIGLRNSDLEVVFFYRAILRTSDSYGQ